MNEPSIKLGKIFIGGLSYETTDDKLRSYFSAFGPVTDAVVMKDPISRRSRGFGFITYADPVCVDRALAQPNHILDSRRVEAKRAVPRAESTSRDSFSSTSSRNGSIISTTSVSSNAGSTKKIFVGGLHYETKDAEFRRYFQQFGKVVSAEVMFNRETNKSRGFGFVIFELEEGVELVLQENNHVIDGKSVEVKRAVPRTDVPPSRSVSSRAGSFCGTAGPGSVGSLDDVSVTSTASISRSGTPSNLESRYNTQPANSALVGYAAAVRFGGRSASRTGSLHQPSPLHDVSNLDNPEKTLARVADRLTSLVLDDDVMTTSLSSSRGSDKVLESPVAPILSPLGIAPRPVTDPVLDAWNLSPARAPQSSLDVPLLSPTEAGTPWHARPWQKGWASQAEREDRAARDHHQQETHTTPSYFSAFAGDRRGSSTPIGHNTWSSPSYAQSNVGTIGSDGNGSVFERSGHSSNGAFGGAGIAMGPRSPYSSLGGFLPNQFLSQTEPELPLDAAFGGGMEDGADEKLTVPLQFEQHYT